MDFLDLTINGINYYSPFLKVMQIVLPWEQEHCLQVMAMSALQNLFLMEWTYTTWVLHSERTGSGYSVLALLLA
jgi:hypothetical protein